MRASILSLLVIAALFATAAAQSSDTQPATAKVFIHEKAIDFLESLVNTAIENALKNVAFPDTSLKIVGGHVDLTKILLVDVTLAENQVGLISPNMLELDIVNVQGALTFDWEYHGLLGIHFGGSGDVSFSDTSIDTHFTFSSQADGRPEITMDSLTCKINHLDVKLHGGGAWLWNFLIDIVKGLVVDILEKKIDDEASGEFNKLVAAIEEKYPVLLPALNGTSLNLPLVTAGPKEQDVPFLMANNNIIAAAQFWFESDTNSTIDARPHSPIPNSIPVNHNGTAPMFGLQVDDYLLGSLLYSLTQNGVFDWVLTDADLPKGSLIQLNTALFATEWPALYAKYPGNNMTMQFYQWSDIGFLAESTAGGTVISDDMIIVMNVVDNTQPNPIVPVAQLRVNLNISALLDMSDNSTGVFLEGKISPLDLDIQVTWSAMDPGTLASALEGLISVLVNDVLIPVVDKFLATGVRMGASTLGTFPLSNLFLDYGGGFISVGFDLSMPAEKGEAMEVYEAFTTL